MPIIKNGGCNSSAGSSPTNFQLLRTQLPIQLSTQLHPAAHRLPIQLPTQLPIPPAAHSAAHSTAPSCPPAAHSAVHSAVHPAVHQLPIHLPSRCPFSKPPMRTPHALLLTPTSRPVYRSDLRELQTLFQLAQGRPSGQVHAPTLGAQQVAVGNPLVPDVSRFAPAGVH